jgi:hypothetical protein
MLELISMPVPNIILSGHGWFIGLHLIIPLLPEWGGGLYPHSPKGDREGVYCFTSVRLSFCPSKIFFVAFFSVTVDGRNLIFGHQRHMGIPYCG